MTTLQKRALFSLHDQDRSEVFAKALIELGWEIIGSRETVTKLSAAGLPVRDVADFVGITEPFPFPPTLHPRLELALTMDAGERLDMVYVSPYPLDVGNDVGGHTLLALACKGNRLPVFTPSDMHRTIDVLRSGDDEAFGLLRTELIARAYGKVRDHYASLAPRPPEQSLAWLSRPLLNGENPYQSPADLLHGDSRDPLAIGRFDQVSGDLPCLTNMADMDCVLQALCACSRAFMSHRGRAPFIAVAAKHGNATGLAVDWDTPEAAIEKALWGNPTAVWGGEVIVNFPITDALGERLLQSPVREARCGSAAWMLDVVVAPSFEGGAASLLGKRAGRKLFRNAALGEPTAPTAVYQYRPVRGGYLRQPPHSYILDLSACRRLAGWMPSDDIVDGLIVAWAAAWFSFHGGNEVALARDGALLACGGGASTVEACHVAVDRAARAGHERGASVFAADAFFPFPDGPEVLIGWGCTHGTVPEGGRRSADIAACFSEHSVDVSYIPGQYRGFYRH